MKKTLQHRNWISRMRLPVASAALALAAVLLPAVITTQSAQAQTFTDLVDFNGTDGGHPAYASLVQGTDGNLYGVTPVDGTHSGGTVFKISTSGTLTTLYNFCARHNCTDGEGPYGALVQAANGNFYGTTDGGGANGAHYGTVFEITPTGALRPLYSFCSQSGCTDGSGPFGGLVQATNGNFYGTTVGGGAYGYGTVFKITLSGTLTTLYSFCSQMITDCTDGAQPWAGLVQGSDGNFYGTTQLGGTAGAGTAFKITPSGTLTTLHSFCSQSFCADGVQGYAGLIQATNGNFYGTTYLGGANNAGTVFRISSGGTLTTLYNFCVQIGCTDGQAPSAALVQATDGSLYGTTPEGGSEGYGEVFKITPTGTLTTVYNFCGQQGCPAGPSAALVQATDGNFYGTAGGGGVDSDGSVFSLSVGLGPFVETKPTAGKVGAAVNILGTNLTGATSVTFNGTAATFTVVSSSEITTTVPAGATSGKVKVVTSSGTLTSNVNFRVKP
jgi:uncharacterized repeat protein (TIGR03803 family)